MWTINPTCFSRWWGTSACCYGLSGACWRSWCPTRWRSAVSLIVPLTVQELTNTFAFAIQPVTIVTLAGVMIAALLFVGAFRSLQYYAVEVLERRLFARVAIGMAQQIPQLQFLGFKPRYANHFMETVFMQRALSCSWSTSSTWSSAARSE